MYSFSRPAENRCCLLHRRLYFIQAARDEDLVDRKRMKKRRKKKRWGKPIRSREGIIQMICYRAPHKWCFNPIPLFSFLFPFSMQPAAAAAAAVWPAILILYPGAVYTAMPSHKFSRDNDDSWRRDNNKKGKRSERDTLLWFLSQYFTTPESAQQ